jgi:hypothetical protein
MNNYSKLVRVIIIIAAVSALLYFIAQDLVWSGRLEFKTDFKKFTPWLTILKPQDQIEIKDTAYIKQEPVWFDLYMPRDFDKVRLEFNYKNDYNYKIEVEPLISEENNPLQVLDDGQSLEKNLRNTSLEFNLRDLPISQGKLRFMISAPQLIAENQGIEIVGLKVLLLRDTIWQEGVIKNLTNYFNYYRHEFR